MKTCLIHRALVGQIGLPVSCSPAHALVFRHSARAKSSRLAPCHDPLPFLEGVPSLLCYLFWHTHQHQAHWQALLSPLARSSPRSCQYAEADTSQDNPMSILGVQGGLRLPARDDRAPLLPRKTDICASRPTPKKPRSAR